MFPFDLPPIPSIRKPAEAQGVGEAAAFFGVVLLPIPEAPLAPKEKGERMVKLARSGMRSHAHRMLKLQDGKCPLCRQPIDLTIKGEGVIDHDHDTGRIRGLLHRSCNAAEGKISNAAARWGAKSSKYSDIIPYLEALTQYLRSEPSNMIYPMHKTPDERKDAAALKRKNARATVNAKRKLAQLKRQGEA